MQGKYDDAIQVLYDSAVLLLKHEQASKTVSPLY